MQNFFETTAGALLDNGECQTILIFVSDSGFVSLNGVLGKAISAVPVDLFDLFFELCCLFDKLFDGQKRVFTFPVFFNFLFFLFVWILFLLRKIFLILHQFLGLFND
jgi:hypothetical protein